MYDHGQAQCVAGDATVAVQHSAAIEITDSSSATFTSCTFLANHAGNSGGTVGVVRSSAATFTSCLFAGNSAGHFAGAIMMGRSDSKTEDRHRPSSVILTLCTFSDNKGHVRRDKFELLVSLCVLASVADMYMCCRMEVQSR